MTGLSARERRLVALALLAALIAAVWLLLVSPLLQGFADRRATRAAATLELARDARLVAAFAAVRRDLAAERRAASAYTVEAASAAQAAEACRQRIERAVAANGGQLQALRTLSAPPRRVRFQADLRIGLAGLIDLLRRVEGERPYAAVDALSVAAPETPDAGGASPLEVRLELTYGIAALR